MVAKIVSKDMSRVSALSISRNLSEESEFAKAASKQETGRTFDVSKVGSALAAVGLTRLDVKTGSDVEFDISEIEEIFY